MRFKLTVKTPAYAVCFREAETWEQAKALLEQQIRDLDAEDLTPDEVLFDDAEVIFVDTEDGQQTFYEV